VELYGLTWVFLAAITFLAQRVVIARAILDRALECLVASGSVLGAFEGLWGTGKAGRIVLPREESESEGEDDAPPRVASNSEMRAKLPRPHLYFGSAASPTHSLVLDETVQDKAFFWWIFQFIISTAAPVVNLATIYVIWIGAMPQTIPDGDWVGTGTSCFALYERHKLTVPGSVCADLTTLFTHRSPIGTFCAQGASRAHCHHTHRLHFLHCIRLDRNTLHTKLPPQSVLRSSSRTDKRVRNNSRPQLTRAVTQLNVIEGYSSRLAATLPSYSARQ
jgi:hypothetical protein